MIVKRIMGKRDHLAKNQTKNLRLCLVTRIRNFDSLNESNFESAKIIYFFELILGYFFAKHRLILLII
jgi:hypothetical protein